jgi:hypothetical protein
VLDVLRAFSASVRSSPARLQRRAEKVLKVFRSCLVERRLAPVGKTLPRIVASLEQFSLQVEKRFVSIGHALRSQSELNTQLIAASQEVIALAIGTGTNCEAVRAPVQLIKDVLQFIDQRGDEIETLIGCLDGFVDRITSLQNQEAAIQRLLAPLGTVEVLFRIESAAMSGELQSVFASLTAEIRHLQQEVESVFTTQTTVLADTKTCLANAASNLRQQLHRQAEIVSEKRHVIEEALSRLEQEIASQTGHDVRLFELTGQVQSETDAIIVALQYQDITKQKIDHIRDALVELIASLSPKTAASDHWTAVAMSARVQSAQLVALEQDLAGATTKLTSHSERLQTALAAIGEECVALSEFKKVTVAMDGIVQVLLDTMSDVRPMIAATESNTSQAFDAVKQLGETAANATRTMQKLATDIRFLALNAQVQAAQVNVLNGLEVLSAETCSIADQTNEFSSVSGSRFDELMSELNAVVQRCEGLRVHTQEGRQGLEERARQAEDQLHAYRDLALQKLQQISELLEQSGQTSSTIEEATNFACIQTSVTAQLRAALENIAEATQGFQHSAQDESDQLKGIFSRYTMQSERSAHVQALSPAASSLPAAEPAPTPEPAPEAQTPPEPAKDNLGDNVELF